MYTEQVGDNLITVDSEGYMAIDIGVSDIVGRLSLGAPIKPEQLINLACFLNDGDEGLDPIEEEEAQAVSDIRKGLILDVFGDLDTPKRLLVMEVIAQLMFGRTYYMTHTDNPFPSEDEQNQLSILSAVYNGKDETEVSH